MEELPMSHQLRLSNQWARVGREKKLHYAVWPWDGPQRSQASLTRASGSRQEVEPAGGAPSWGFNETFPRYWGAPECRREVLAGLWVWEQWAQKWHLEPLGARAPEGAPGTHLNHGGSPQPWETKEGQRVGEGQGGQEKFQRVKRRNKKGEAWKAGEKRVLERKRGVDQETSQLC